MKTPIQAVVLRPHSSDTLRPRVVAMRHAGSFSRCSGSNCFSCLLLAVCILLGSGGTSAMPPTVVEGRETTAEDLSAMLDTGEGPIATLVVEKTQLAVGRTVLSASSQFFAAMFAHDPLEARRQEIVFPDVEDPELRKLVAFTNSGMARQLPVKSPQLLEAATEYGVSGLRGASEQQLAKPLAVDNAAANAVLAETHDYPTLRQAAIVFIRDQVFQVKATQGREEAVHIHPQLIVQLASLLVEPTTVTRTTAAEGNEATPTTRSHSDHGQTPTAATTASPCPNTPPLDEAYVSRLRNLSDNEKFRRLSKAAERGEVEEVRALLAAGADVGVGDDNGWTALHVAAYNGDVRSVGCLLNAGAEVGARQGRLRTTPLHWAAQMGQTSVVRLLAASADPDARDTRGRTPLHMAAVYGQAGAATALLEGGADKGAMDDDGKTPLDLARKENHQQLMQILESDPASASWEDTPTTWPQSEDGDTPEAATPSSTYPDISPLDEEAVSHLRNPAAEGSDHGQTLAAATTSSLCPNTPPLDEAYVSRLRNLSDGEKNSKLAKAAEQGVTSVARALLAAGADVGAGEWYGWTALHIAAYNGQVGVVGCLLQAGADIGARQGSLRTTPLHWAAQMGQTSVVRLLLAASADPDVRDTWGRTPLYMAAMYGQPGAATALLEAGADKGATDENGKTPMSLAREKNNQQLMQILESDPATARWEDTPTMWPQTDEGDTPEAATPSSTYPDISSLDDEILSYLRDPDSASWEDFPAMWAQSDDGDTPEAATPSSTYPDISPLDDEAVSHLRTTAAAGSEATPTTRSHSDHGQTPAAATMSTLCPDTPPLDEAYVSRLRNLSDGEKNSKLAKAAEQGATVEARALLAAGTDLGVGEWYGWTALHIAAYNGQVGVVGCLLNVGADVAARQGPLRTTPLHWAAQMGQTGVVRLLLAASADPDARDTRGRTPLHMAAVYGQAGAATALLEGGADKGGMDNDGKTPLDLAREENHQQLMQILESDPASAGWADTPAMWAQSDDGDNPSAATPSSTYPDISPLDDEAVSHLRFSAAAGSEATPTTRSHSDHGQTPASATTPSPCPNIPPLDEAFVSRLRNLSDNEKFKRLSKAAMRWDVEEVRALLAAGADVGAGDVNGWTALHVAAYNGDVRSVGCLLDAGADVAARQGSLRTAPLHWAAQMGQTSVVRLLLAASADPDTRDTWGRTPLYLAAMFGQEGAATALLEAGADKGLTDDEGETALDLAREENHQQLMQILERY